MLEPENHLYFRFEKLPKIINTKSTIICLRQCLNLILFSPKKMLFVKAKKRLYMK